MISCPGWPSAGTTTWAFDVDGTIIGSIRSDRLRPGTQELLTALVGRGIRCVLWSAGGRSHAQATARRHELERYFDGFYAKGERDRRARYRTEHLPHEHRPHLFVDDAPADLPENACILAVPQFFGGNAADRALIDITEALDRAASIRAS